MRHRNVVTGFSANGGVAPPTFSNLKFFIMYKIIAGFPSDKGFEVITASNVENPLECLDWLGDLSDENKSQFVDLFRTSPERGAFNIKRSYGCITYLYAKI